MRLIQRHGEANDCVELQKGVHQQTLHLRVVSIRGVGEDSLRFLLLLFLLAFGVARGVARLVGADHAVELNPVLVCVNLVNLRADALKVSVVEGRRRVVFGLPLAPFVVLYYVFDVLEHRTESVALGLALLAGRQLLFRQKIDAFRRELFALSILALMENSVEAVGGDFFSFGGLQRYLFPGLRVAAALLLPPVRSPAVGGHLPAYVWVLVRADHEFELELLRQPSHEIKLYAFAKCK